MPDPATLLLLVPITLFLILAMTVIMAGNKGRLTETRLIMLGIFLNVTAVLFDALQPMIVAAQMRSGPPNLPLVTVTSTGGLVKIGVLLVLAGVVSFLMKSGERAATPTEGEVPRVP